MASVNRFIQFNNETVDARMLKEMELLTRALADAPYLQLKTRKLLEFRPSEETVAVSVFWKHREKQIERNGYLSDVYLIGAGFWRYFDLSAWRTYAETPAKLPSLREQLLLCAEEFRLSEQVQRERPGTVRSFRIREEVMAGYHRQQLNINRQKGFRADAFLNAAYLMLRSGQPEGSEELGQLMQVWSALFDARSTADSVRVTEAVMARLDFLLEHDMIHTYYTLGDAPDRMPHRREHKGAETEEEQEQEVETIDEWFQTWHREMEQEQDTALEYELERGDSANAAGGREEAGAEEVRQTARGESGGEDHRESGDAEDRDAGNPVKQAGREYGREHENVVYEEKRIIPDPAVKDALNTARKNQEVHVRALLKELRKRMTQKQEGSRTNLNAGRLSKRLTAIATEERPKLFYRKTAPTGRLDAVFSLLIDGSASMIDKLDETKQAVVLFHDVLRQLEIPHEIVLFYEDAFEAGEERQPNVFEWMHRFEDGVRDHGTDIFSMEAHEDNRDGFAIRWMTRRMRHRPEKHRFLLVFSDGEPSAYNYAQNGIVDTASAVGEARKSGIEVLHLFLSGEEVTEEQTAVYRMMYGNKSVSAGSLERFTDETLRLLKRTLHLVIQSV